jgi:hypothetical protein
MRMTDLRGFAREFLRDCRLMEPARPGTIATPVSIIINGLTVVFAFVVIIASGVAALAIACWAALVIWHLTLAGINAVFH